MMSLLTNLFPPNHRVLLVPMQMVCSPASWDVKVNLPSAA